LSRRKCATLGARKYRPEGVQHRLLPVVDVIRVLLPGIDQ
jgi:hypothetical protein